MRIAVIVGTRPEAIKMAPVILGLRAETGLECRVCVTGQHRELLGQVLPVFGISPDVDLDLMKPDQTLASLTAKAIARIDEYLALEKPDLVLVQGDTTTVLCASLAAFYRGVPVGHVEAGLRTWNMKSPWPEEANRVITSRLAALHFAPTPSNRRNLLKEGVMNNRIFVTGNTVIDALHLALDRLKEAAVSIPGLPESSLDFLGGSPLVLVTCHRRESFGSAFRNICNAIAKLACVFPDVHFVYPVHPNPNVRQTAQEILGNVGRRVEPEICNITTPTNVHLIEPVGYLPFVALMNRADLILTDSGGVQEEAPSLGKTVLVMRETTERPEALRAGTIKLVGTSTSRIVEETTRILDHRMAVRLTRKVRNPYGDGLAAPRIVAACKAFLSAAR